MRLLDDATVESMLRDVRLLEGNFGDLADDMRGDLCCHIKALAADREELRRMVMEQQAKVEKLNNEKVAATATTGQQLSSEWKRWRPDPDDFRLWQEIHEIGWRARERGEHREANPFAVASGREPEAFRWWDSGWVGADEEMTDEEYQRLEEDEE